MSPLTALVSKSRSGLFSNLSKTATRMRVCGKWNFEIAACLSSSKQTVGNAFIQAAFANDSP